MAWKLFVILKVPMAPNSKTVGVVLISRYAHNSVPGARLVASAHAPGRNLHADQPRDAGEMYVHVLFLVCFLLR